MEPEGMRIEGFGPVPYRNARDGRNDHLETLRPVFANC